MSVKVLNPENPMMQQAEGHWQQFAMLILWKLNGREKVNITDKDIERFRSEFQPGIPVMLTHGHVDSIDFQIVDEEAASRIAEYDATRKGTA